MIDIELKNGQTGYDAVAEYILRYWDRNVVEDVIISIGTSYDGNAYCLRKEVASPLDAYDVEYLNDWWEGERYIKLFGIKTVSEVDISGGLYEDATESATFTSVWDCGHEITTNCTVDPNTRTVLHVETTEVDESLDVCVDEYVTIDGDVFTVLLNNEGKYRY